MYLRHNMPHKPRKSNSKRFTMGAYSLQNTKISGWYHPPNPSEFNLHLHLLTSVGQKFSIPIQIPIQNVLPNGAGLDTIPIPSNSRENFAQAHYFVQFLFLFIKWKLEQNNHGNFS